MYKLRLTRLIYEELKKQAEDSGESYVGERTGLNDYTDISLDGYFNLEAIAEVIMEELQDE